MHEIEVTVTGNVCSDVRLATTEAGTPVASFRVASTPRWMRDGAWTDGPTTFTSVTCWRGLAEHVAASVGKGAPVIVSGRLSVRSWEADGGRSGQSVEIDARHVGLDLLFGTGSLERATRREVERDEPADAEPVAAGHAM